LKLFELALLLLSGLLEIFTKAFIKLNCTFTEILSEH